MKDLSKLLQNSIGETFYCTILGNVQLIEIDPKVTESIVIKYKNKTFYLDKYGRYYFCFCPKETECILFPSKDNRDWNTYTPKIPIDTPVMVLDNERGWILRYSAGEPKTVFVKGRKSTDNVDKVKYKVVIPVENFNFNDAEEHTLITF